MYRKDSTGWIKHVDFIILDLICLQVAFVLAYALSGYGANPYQLILYRNMAVFMEVADLVVLFAMGTLKNVLKRGYYKDFVVTAQHGVILGACLLLYLFMLQEGQQYSRLALVLNIVIYILLTYLVRELWKHLLRKKMEDGENRSLLLVVSADVVSAVVESMKEHNYARYKIAGIAVIDKEMTGKYVDGVKVVANMENLPSLIVAICVVYIMKNRRYILITVTAGLMIIGIFTDTYGISFPKVYYTIFLTTRNGLFMGSFLVAIGKCLADYESKLRNLKKWKLILPVAIVALYVEGGLISKFDSERIINIAFTSVIVSIILVTIMIGLPQIKASKNVRNMSTVIYLCHPCIMVIINLSDHLGIFLNAGVKSFISMIMSILAALAVVKLSNKFKIIDNFM